MKVWIVLACIPYEGEYVEGVHATKGGAKAAAQAAEKKTDIGIPAYVVSEWDVQE